MQVRHFFPILAVILIVGVMILSGCGRSPNPRFYTLSALPEQFGSTRASQAHNAVVGIGPIKIADYLDQSQIVTRTSDNQLVKDEFNRWGGPFRNNFTNVLADNIGYLLPTQQIHLFPWRQAVAIDYQVTVDVVRCDGRLGDAAVLESRWSLFQGPDKKLVTTRRSSLTEAVTGPDYADLVAAQSRAIGRLSQEIVQAIKGAGRP